MASLTHECDHLREALEIDLGLPRHGAPLRLEIERHHRTGDLLRGAGLLDNRLDHLAAIFRCADEAKGIGRGTHEAYHHVLVVGGPRTPCGDNLKLEGADRFGRVAEPPVAFVDRDQIVWLPKRHPGALAAFETFETSRRANKLLDLVGAVTETVLRKQLACGDRDR